jgi:hypothetical protein
VAEAAHHMSVQAILATAGLGTDAAEISNWNGEMIRDALLHLRKAIRKELAISDK